MNMSQLLEGLDHSDQGGGFALGTDCEVTGHLAPLFETHHPGFCEAAEGSSKA